MSDKVQQPVARPVVSIQHVTKFQTHICVRIGDMMWTRDMFGQLTQAEGESVWRKEPYKFVKSTRS